MITTNKKVEIDKELFKIISKKAKKENTTVDEFLNHLIKKEFSENLSVFEEKSNLLDADILKDEDIPSFFELAGIIKDGEPFSAVEEVRKMRGKE
ncbi:MAG: hypothetical protein FWH29_10460 [Methanobrevibacter sp.]|nr:hypothetical protein [Methanobrevibacter sp.]